MITTLMKMVYFPSYLIFLITNRTPKVLYILHRKLFVRTNGRLNDFMTRQYAKWVGTYEIPEATGVLGKINDANAQAIAASIDDKGYHIFDIKLNDATIDKLQHFARTEPAHALALKQKIGFTEEEYLFNEKEPIAPKYSFNGDRLLTSPVLRKIAFDESLLKVAQSYLKARPILDAISLWWSAPFQGKGTSGAAQEYHFDMDRIKFLKFFFYLTDVHEESGPHCYVPRSHKGLPDKLRKDGRMTDHEIKKYFSETLEICGKKGSIIAVDTRGLHKGKPLTKDYRLLLQLEYTNSLFGQKYPTFQSPDKDQLKTLKGRYPRSYQLIS